GRVTAGHQGAAVKANQQIDEASRDAAKAQAIVLQALERHPLFISAALPNVVYPPMFNRYAAGMSFGPHVDGGVRIDPLTGRKLLFEMDGAIQLLNRTAADADARRSLVGCYHNLLRQWAEV